MLFKSRWEPGPSLPRQCALESRSRSRRRHKTFPAQAGAVTFCSDFGAESPFFRSETFLLGPDMESKLGYLLEAGAAAGAVYNYTGSASPGRPSAARVSVAPTEFRPAGPQFISQDLCPRSTYVARSLICPAGTRFVLEALLRFAGPWFSSWRPYSVPRGPGCHPGGPTPSRGTLVLVLGP